MFSLGYTCDCFVVRQYRCPFLFPSVDDVPSMVVTLFTHFPLTLIYICLIYLNIRIIHFIIQDFYNCCPCFIIGTCFSTFHFCYALVSCTGTRLTERTGVWNRFSVRFSDKQKTGTRTVSNKKYMTSLNHDFNATSRCLSGNNHALPQHLPNPVNLL